MDGSEASGEAATMLILCSRCRQQPPLPSVLPTDRSGRGAESDNSQVGLPQRLTNHRVLQLVYVYLGNLATRVSHPPVPPQKSCGT